MPQKKPQHKGKPKQSTQENEEYVFSKTKTEQLEEEYTTVVDYETDRKYSKRLIENNWAKYEANAADFECGNDEESPATDDFSSLIQNASSDCSHFQFSSEKSWSEAENTIPASEVFNLDLNLLAKGLSCLPFYKRIDLDESRLSAEDKARLDREAAKNLEEYKEILKNLKKSKVPESPLEEVLDKKINLNEPECSTEKEPESLEVKKVETFNSDTNVNTEKEMEKDDVITSTKKQFFSDNDENLEDWLDSVLDD